MAQYDEVWPTSIAMYDEFGRVWEYVIEYCNVWPRIVEYDRVWQSMTECSQVWISMTEDDRISRVVQHSTVWHDIIEQASMV